MMHDLFARLTAFTLNVALLLLLLIGLAKVIVPEYQGLKSELFATHDHR